MLERARKKSAKQLLDEKQIKRYLRSKKRSQKREQVSLDKRNIIENQKREKLFAKNTRSSTNKENGVQATFDHSFEENFGKEENMGKTKDKKIHDASDSLSKEQGKVAPCISRKTTE